MIFFDHKHDFSNTHIIIIIIICSKIKEIINRKDREFKGCLTDTSKPLKLIGVDGDIQRFIGECTTFQECFSKRSARNNQVSLKSTNTDQCEKNSRCNNGNSRTGGMGSKQQQRLITEKSKTESSPRQKPQSTGAEQAEGKDSKQKMLVSQTPMIANALPNFVKTQHGGSESVNNNQSTTSAQVDPSSQPSTVPGHKSPTEEDNHAISPTQLSRFGQKPDSGISVQQIHTDENPVPKNSPDDQLYRNTPGEGDTTEQIVLGQDIARQGDVTETPDSEVLASKGFVQTYPSRTNADGLQPSSSDTSNVVATRVHVENSHSHTVNTYGDTSLKVNGEAVHHEHLRSTVPEIKDSGTERPADSDTIHDNIPNVGRDDTNISDVNAAGDESRSGEGSCTEPPCITEKGNILTDEKSDVFRRIFEAISNDDFEYSSFDQNVY
ncbi:PIR protein [Plasmodium vivax]|uniref:VIR protein n=1 Tax=Plasmodium vivax TaxID=5855 RepID=A0A565A647_PLAVI|nr:PIR protein [Plasmodium vivax]